MQVLRTTFSTRATKGCGQGGVGGCGWGWRAEAVVCVGAADELITLKQENLQTDNVVSVRKPSWVGHQVPLCMAQNT